eukprot:4685419-Lingulodinium_polyedra.AAC.2
MQTFGLSVRKAGLASVVLGLGQRGTGNVGSDGADGAGLGVDVKIGARVFVFVGVRGRQLCPRPQQANPEYQMWFVWHGGRVGRQGRRFCRCRHSTQGAFGFSCHLREEAHERGVGVGRHGVSEVIGMVGVLQFHADPRGGAWVHRVPKRRGRPGCRLFPGGHDAKTAIESTSARGSPGAAILEGHRVLWRF